jgi:hypothetical protein
VSFASYAHQPDLSTAVLSKTDDGKYIQITRSSRLLREKLIISIQKTLMIDAFKRLVVDHFKKMSF